MYEYDIEMFGHFGVETYPNPEGHSNWPYTFPKIWTANFLLIVWQLLYIMKGMDMRIQGTDQTLKAEKK